MEEPVEAPDTPNYVIDVSIDGNDANPEESDFIFGGSTQMFFHISCCLSSFKWHHLNYPKP